MNKKLKITTSIILIASSLTIIGITYTTKVGHPISTILFLLGIICFFIALIWFILSIKSSKKTN